MRITTKNSKAETAADRAKMAFDVRSAGIGVTQRADLNHRTGDFHDEQQVRICGFGK